VQEIPESVKATVGAINKELRLKPQAAEASLEISGQALRGGSAMRRTGSVRSVDQMR
jgi:hypothetical protein